jgi:hypothetical protein
MARIPKDAQMDVAFEVMMPKCAKIVRSGIDPASGGPAFWYVCNTEDEELLRNFIVVLTDAQLEWPATHRGMWWAAADTFHLFELEYEEIPAVYGDPIIENEDGGVRC